MTDMLTVREVAAYLRLSQAQVYVLCSRKSLPHIRLGKRLIVRRTELEEWLKKQTVPA